MRPDRFKIALLLTVALMQPIPATVSAQTQAPEEFTVTRRLPGPPLWKVQRGDNQMWIFGTLDQVPENMTWDDSAVAALLSRADIRLQSPGISARTLNPVTMFKLYRKWRKFERIDGKATLADIVPPDLYGRYDVLRQQYGVDEDDSDQRPVIAAGHLYAKASRSTGLTSGREIDQRIERLAKTHKVKLLETQFHVKPMQLMDDAAELAFEQELACFESIVATVEQDLDAMAERATAWASGSIEQILAFDYPDAQGSCLEFIGSSDGLQQVMQDSRLKWLAMAEYALSNYEVSFATLSVRELVHADGLIAQLEQRGFTVRPPAPR